MGTRRWWMSEPAALRERLRVKAGSDAQPSACIILSQSVKTTGVGGIRGYDGGKKLSGRKRHLVVETQGLVLRANVHSANIQDRAAVPLVLKDIKKEFPRLQHTWVGQGYMGTGREWITEQLGWTVEVVSHRPKPRGIWAPVGAVIDWEKLHPNGFRGGSAQELGGGEDSVLARPEPRAQQGLRKALRDQRDPDLHRDDSVDGKEAGSYPTFQTVSSNAGAPEERRCGLRSLGRRCGAPRSAAGTSSWGRRTSGARACLSP